MIRNFADLDRTCQDCSSCLDAKFTGSDGRRHVVLCGGTGCLSSHSDEIREEFVKIINEKGLHDKVTVNQVGCFGFCSQGPFVKIYPEDTLYRMVKIDDVKEIVEKDLENGEVVDRLLYVDPVTKEKISKQDDITFYKKQVRIALHGCGSINPEKIEEALGAGAFKGLERALQMDRQEVINEILASGPSRTRRRRIPHGQKVAIRIRSTRRRKVCRLQRRRRRPGRVYGPFHSRRKPPCRHRRYDDCRLRNRRAKRLFLCPRRIPHRGQQTSYRNQASGRTRTFGRQHSWNELLVQSAYPSRRRRVRMR